MAKTEAQKASDRTSSIKIYDKFGIAIRKDSAVYGVLPEAIENSGLTRGIWINEAIREKLVRDGYLLDTDK